MWQDNIASANRLRSSEAASAKTNITNIWGSNHTPEKSGQRAPGWGIAITTSVNVFWIVLSISSPKNIRRNNPSSPHEHYQIIENWMRGHWPGLVPLRPSSLKASWCVFPRSMDSLLNSLQTCDQIRNNKHTGNFWASLLLCSIYRMVSPRTWVTFITKTLGERKVISNTNHSANRVSKAAARTTSF